MQATLSQTGNFIYISDGAGTTNRKNSDNSRIRIRKGFEVPLRRKTHQTYMSTIVLIRRTGWRTSCRTPEPLLPWLPTLAAPTRCNIRLLAAAPFLSAM